MPAFFWGVGLGAIAQRCIKNIRNVYIDNDLKYNKNMPELSRFLGISIWKYLKRQKQDWIQYVGIMELILLLNICMIK